MVWDLSKLPKELNWSINENLLPISSATMMRGGDKNGQASILDKQETREANNNNEFKSFVEQGSFLNPNVVGGTSMV